MSMDHSVFRRSYRPARPGVGWAPPTVSVSWWAVPTLRIPQPSIELNPGRPQLLGEPAPLLVADALPPVPVGRLDVLRQVVHEQTLMWIGLGEPLAVGEVLRVWLPRPGAERRAQVVEVCQHVGEL